MAAIIGLFTVEVERSTPPRRHQHLLHRSALGPGTVLFLGLIPLAGFTAFVPLYVDDLNVNAGAIFVLYGVLILGVRIFGGATARPARRASDGNARADCRGGGDRADRGVAHGRRSGGRNHRVRGRHVAHVPGAAAAGARRRERGRARVGGRHVLVVLRPVAGPRRVRVRHGRARSPATGARSPTGAVVARSAGSQCCAARSATRARRARCRVVAVPSLLVTNDFPPKLGGIQSYLYELWRRLPPAETTVLTTPFAGAAAWDAAAGRSASSAHGSGCCCRRRVTDAAHRRARARGRAPT